MKKVTFIASMLIITSSMFGQNLKLDTLRDDMTDKVHYSMSEGFMCISEDNTKGFRVDPNITESESGLEIKNLIVQMLGLGNCNKSNKIIILFEDGTKIEITSWNKFNCKGSAYFSVNQKHRDVLSVNAIQKIRLQNGDSFKEYTHEPTNKKYFIELFSLIK